MTNEQPAIIAARVQVLSTDPGANRVTVASLDGGAGTIQIGFRDIVRTEPRLVAPRQPAGVAGLTMQERVASYEAAFPKFPKGVLHVSSDGRISGTFVMGQNYTVKSSYYGGYPHGYLARMKAIFPEKQRTLHAFSGRVDLDAFPGDTVDINADLSPTYIDDAQSLVQVPLASYDLVLADPPYSVEDAEHYGTPLVQRNKVMKALERLPVGAHVVWLDQVLPMYRKDFFKIAGVIGMVKSTNHRFRMITIFERHNGGEGASSQNPHE